MLASVSISQPTVHSHYVPQQRLTESSQADSDLEKKSTDAIKSEARKLTQKAAAELTQEDQQTIQQLKQRDTEVKAHEQAHLSAAGAIAIGGASFTYTTGPNGVRYAVGGEVSIDTSPINGDPAATLRKADAIRRAALAPASPSSQDQAVAANATSMAETARADLIKLTQELKAEKIDQPEQTKDQEENTTDVDTSDSSPESPDAGSIIDLII